MRSIKLYGTASATANNVANVTIPTSTRIVGVQYAFTIDSLSDNGSVIVEISQASATEIAVNGAQQAVCEIRAYVDLLTSGAFQASQNGFLPVDVPVKQGQIIYLHTVVVATSTFYFTGLLWVRD